MHDDRLSTFAMLACFALPLATPAKAQPRYETVAQCYRTCVDETNGKVNGRCEAYLTGAAGTLSAFGNECGIGGQGVPSGELSRILLEWGRTITTQRTCPGSPA